MYVHYWGEGSEATLADALRTALLASKTPLTPAPAPPASTRRPTRDSTPA